MLPTIAAIAARYRERTVFTRFVTPASPENAPGQWQAYFRRWKRATQEMLDPGQLELVPELVRYVPPAVVVDKPAYSAFFRSPLAAFLLERNVRTVVVSGAKTDVCVLSTVLDAVNIGFRVVHYRGCAVQLFRRGTRRADDDVPAEIQRADRSRHGRRSNGYLAA